MKIHQQKNKMTLVTEREKLFQMIICLSESPVLANRKLALELKEALEDMNSKGA